MLRLGGTGSQHKIRILASLIDCRTGTVSCLTRSVLRVTRSALYISFTAQRLFKYEYADVEIMNKIARPGMQLRRPYSRALMIKARPEIQAKKINSTRSFLDDL